jgi:hypothetical protein
MQDFNKMPIERAIYLDSKTGTPIKVIQISQCEGLRYFSPGDYFEATQLPPKLSEDLASRLIRIKNPRNLRDFLGDSNLFCLLESSDPYPINGSQDSPRYPSQSIAQSQPKCTESLDFCKFQKQEKQERRTKTYEKISHQADHLFR